MRRRLLAVLLGLLGGASLLGWVRVPTLPLPTWSLLDVTLPTNPRHPLNRGLVAHWQVLPQTNQAGSVWRSTAPMAAPFPGTLTGILPTSATSGWNPTTRPGGFGEMRFDGINDVIYLGINAGGGRLQGAPGATVAAWVNWSSLNATSDNIYLLFLMTSNTAALRIGLPGATPGIVKMGGRSTASDPFQEVTSLGTVPTATWTHIVGVVDYPADTMTLYLNGVLDVSTSVTFNATAFSNSSGSAQDILGASWFDLAEFVGALDDIRVLTRALSASEVAALYDATRTLHNPTLQWLPHLVAQPSSALAVKPRRGGSY